MEEKIRTNLFAILEENGYNKKEVANRLCVRNYSMTVVEFLKRFRNGGMHHRYFQKINELCLSWCFNNGIDCDLITCIA